MSTKKSISESDIKLVLNGGSRELDTATVPVEWHFSDKLIAQKPRYIVICDHEFSIAFFKKNITYNNGKRHAFAVKDLIGYVQVQKAGVHHFLAVVFCGEEESALKSVRSFLAKNDRYQYKYDLSYDNLETNSYGAGASVAAMEFEVPEGLFAKKPKTTFGKFVWRWSNRWFENEPIDQCAYRKRKILAFTLQPMMFIIGRLLWGIAVSLYTLIGGLLVFLFGGCPKMSNLVDIWTDNWDDKVETQLERYPGVWRQYNDKGSKIPVWAVPIILIFEIAGCIGIIYLLYLLFLHTSLVLFLIIIVLISIIVIVIKKFISYSKKESTKREVEEEVKRIRLAEDKKYLNYLIANTTFGLTPTKVNVGDILKKVDTTTRFKLSFWATKAKVCRPFAK